MWMFAKVSILGHRKLFCEQVSMEFDKGALIEFQGVEPSSLVASNLLFLGTA